MSQTLEEIGENWYQRTHRLREVWQDDNETPQRVFKAFYLWSIMSKRVLKVTHKLAEKTVYPIKYMDFEPGGIGFDPNGTEPIISSSHKA